MRQAGFWEFGLDRAIRETVRATPAPPRPAAFGRLARLSYGSGSGKVVVGLALMLCLPLAAIEFWGSLSDPGHLVIAFPSAAFTALLLIAPALPARRAAQAVHRGVIAEASVLEARHAEQGIGTAAGRWRVSHPSGGFDESFAVDGPVAADLRAGDRVRVLIDPYRHEGLFLLSRDETEAPSFD